MGMGRTIAWCLAIEAAIAVLLIWGVQAATAATPQAEANRIAGWMAAELRADVPTRTLAATRHHQLDIDCGADNLNWIAYQCSTDMTTLRIRPWLAGALQRHTCHALRVMLHELAHSTRGFGDIDVEEGIADALSMDLYPKAARDLHCRDRRVYEPDTFYPVEAEDIWTTSTIATHSKDRWTRRAREWVRKLWAADAAGRRVMITTAQRTVG